MLRLMQHFVSSVATTKPTRCIDKALSQLFLLDHCSKTMTSLAATAPLPPIVSKIRTKATLFDLCTGTLPPDILETALGYISKATNRLFDSSPTARSSPPTPQKLLDYGPEPGELFVRERVAEFLSRRYRCRVDADWIVLSAGCTQALHLLPSILFRNVSHHRSEGEPFPSAVFVEEPTYMHALDILEGDYEFNVKPVQTDNFGVRPDALEKLLKDDRYTAQRGSNLPRSMLYMQTAYQNPSGICVPRDRFLELEAVARRYNILLVVDDVYSLVNFESDNVADAPEKVYMPSVASGEFSDVVVTLGTTSKIIGPGLRFGWIVAPPKIRNAIVKSGFYQSGGCPSQLSSWIVGQMIAEGYVDVMTDLVRKSMKERFAIASSVLSAHLPGCVTFSRKQYGGFFLWLGVPKQPGDNASENLVNHLANLFGVKVIDGDRFVHSVARELGGDLKFIRVSLSAAPIQQLPEALLCLAQGIADYLNFKPTI